MSLVKSTENSMRNTISSMMEPLQKKSFKKLVLSRPAFYPLNEDFSPLGTFIKACNEYPRMMIYLCHTPATGTWMGSTPEIMISGHGEKWSTVALAGYAKPCILV